jgi:hypothetical protein
MQAMKFAIPVGCRNEVFSTARMGKKWETRIKSGVRQVELQDTTGKSIGTADILDLWVGPLSAVPAILLESYHDPVARTWSGLHACLQNIYDKAIDPSDHFTVMRLGYTGAPPEGKIQVASAAELKKLNGKPLSFGGRG